MKEEIRTLILYRLDRAHESLGEAKVLFENGFANAFVNRLYYASFYAVSALLLIKGFSSAKHTGIRSYFHQNFIKTEIISKKFGKMYDKFFDSRHQGDYEDFVRFDIDEVRDWYDEAKKFVETIEQLVHTEIDKNHE